ncbi:MAG: sporulation initiation factor Spo0A C-terminal domain-containing protein [Christensenellales bacterium]|jgi:two-component system response regulator (stage 0 sporulation protein A)
MSSKIKVLLSESCDFKSSSALVEAFRKIENVEVLGNLHDGHTIVKRLERGDVDLLILELVLPNMDGLEVLRAIQEMRFRKRPVVIVCSAISVERIIEEAIALGASYYLPRHASAAWCARRAVELYDIVASSEIVVAGRRVDANLVRMRITELLRHMGVPPHLKGYGYIKSALFSTVRDPNLLNATTTELYPLIAKQNGTVPGLVERMMRHTIETTWNRGDIDCLIDLFGYSVSNERSRPTNTEFLARLTDDLLMQL